VYQTGVTFPTEASRNPSPSMPSNGSAESANDPSLVISANSLRIGSYKSSAKLKQHNLNEN